MTTASLPTGVPLGDPRSPRRWNFIKLALVFTGLAIVVSIAKLSTGIVSMPVQDGFVDAPGFDQQQFVWLFAAYVMIQHY
jgi:hypothetical protein